MFVDVARARKQGVAEIEKVKQRVANNPKDIEAKKYLANLYKFTGKVTEAESLLLEAIRLQPESAEAHNDLAIFYADQRRHDKAIKLYRRATELKSHHILYLSLGNSLRKLGRNEEAFEAFRKAIDIKPDSIHPLKFYADALRETGKRREAVEIYQKILKIEPNNSPALFNLAILSLKLMDLESAQRYYETLRKADAPLAKNLSWILRLKK
jgi:tetratricopeptide (TPR) repeat protein